MDKHNLTLHHRGIGILGNMSCENTNRPEISKVDLRSFHKLYVGMKTENVLCSFKDWLNENEHR